MNFITALLISIVFTFAALALFAGLILLLALQWGRFFDSPAKRINRTKSPTQAIVSSLTRALSFFRKPPPHPESSVNADKINLIEESIGEPETLPALSTRAEMAHPPGPAESTGPATPIAQPQAPSSRPAAAGNTAVAAMKIQRVTLGTGAYLRSRNKKRSQTSAAQESLRQVPAEASSTPGLRASFSPLPVQHRCARLSADFSRWPQVYTYSHGEDAPLPGSPSKNFPPF